MSSCPHCQNPLTGSESACTACGQTVEQPDSNDNLDFVVTEAHDGSHELVGGVSASKTDSEPESDLKTQSSAEFLQDEAPFTDENETNLPDLSLAPIGVSEPTLASPVAESESPNRETEDSPATETDNAQVRKLTPDQVASIRKQMYGTEAIPETNEPVVSAEGNSDEHKGTGFDNAPIVPPKSSEKHKDHKQTKIPAEKIDGPAPKMAARSRGIAYFAKHLVQITGEQELFEGDELTINDRHYVLRKKRISSKTLYMVIAPLAAILLFVMGAMFTADSTGETGRIVGLVLDDYGKPFLQGATIRLPESGNSFRTNSQGFFKTDPLERGSYKIEYVIDGEVFKTDFATVVGGEITTLSMHPDPLELTSSAKPVATSTKQKVQKTQTKIAAKTQSTKSPSKKATPKKSSKTTQKTSSKKAKLKLAANVKGAKITLDGSVLGAGNLTYSRLKPGGHKYTISADGYADKSGTVKLRAGKTTKLKIDLKPLTTAAKKKTYLEEDYFYSGKKALKKGDYPQAINDLSEAIKIRPSYADAYNARAQAYDRTGEQIGASDDYLRAGEQYRMKGDYRNAMSSFGKAISTNPQNIGAFLGRGFLYIARGEEIAAIADFETVKDLDKRNFEAYMGLGRARFNQGYYKKAIKHFNDAKSINSNNPGVYQYLMLSYLAADDIKKVKKSYDRFLKVAGQRELDQFSKEKKYTAIRRVLK